MDLEKGLRWICVGIPLEFVFDVCVQNFIALKTKIGLCPDFSCSEDQDCKKDGCDGSRDGFRDGFAVDWGYRDGIAMTALLGS